MQNDGLYNMIEIDTMSAWEIAALVPNDQYKIIDVEEGYEFRGENKIDYRKVIFKVESENDDELNGRMFLLTTAAWDDNENKDRLISFFSYASERWTKHTDVSVICPEMVMAND